MKGREEIISLEEEQKTLKKEIEDLKRKIPYFIFTFLLFTFVIIYLFEDKANQIFANNTTFTIFCGIALILVFLIYLILIFKKIKKKTIETKEISNKIYNLMKLNT